MAECRPVSDVGPPHAPVTRSVAWDEAFAVYALVRMVRHAPDLQAALRATVDAWIATQREGADGPAG